MNRCEPVYCCYQLFDQPMHQTDKKLQSRHIYWNDLNLYLMSKKKKRNFHLKKNFRVLF